VEAGADVNKQNKDGVTALIFALHKIHPGAAEQVQVLKF
jgi:ankyrin repeat protein